ncbi:hypothetical protein F4776DRAFT_643331 [Hypoxylon sp. NC0597]|nr:hypothetical protein F4776DRAFT_643331 [Hypoxylon sp. NC0597]
MPKLINSASYELGLAKLKIEDLIKRQHELEAEVLQLKTHIRKHNLPLPKTSQPTIKSPRLDKNFLKPTAASLNRSIQAPQQQSSEDTETGPRVIIETWPNNSEYIDGMLVKIPDPEDRWARYRQPTTSSEKKQREKFFKVEIKEEDYMQSDCDTSLNESSNRWSDNDDRAWIVEEGESTEVEDESPAEAMKRSLSERSRLRDRVKSHLDDVPIRSHILIDHLQRALRLAQDTFYYGAKKYYPRAVSDIQGPREVRWGRSEMQFCFFYRIGGNGLEIAGIHYRTHALEAEFDNITRLRNTICHFCPSDSTHYLRTYDGFIRAVQELAIIFGDEYRAFRARALRDKLSKEAENSLMEIESLGLLAMLPQARPWELHHVRAFQRIISSRRDYEDDDEEGCPLPLLRAAREWDIRRPVPSGGDWLPESFEE